MDVSIVIPAFNEAPKIGRDMEAAASFLEANGFEGEIIVVDDGSTDGTAAEAGGAEIPPSIRKIVLRLDRNSGKGAAVRRGILETRGNVVLYADSGNCIPYANALPVIKRVAAGDLDAGLASRRLRNTVILRNRPLRRRLLSRFFHWAAVIVAGLPRRITDSQCGFKVYRGHAARELFAGLVTTGFLFELEIILKALRRGLRLEEFPVEWTCDLDTRLRPASQAGSVFKELFKVRSLAKK
ncbi:MAG: glycosyltransferase [Candidatus Aminicenantales bacterium]